MSDVAHVVYRRRGDSVLEGPEHFSYRQLEPTDEQTKYHPRRESPEFPIDFLIISRPFVK